VVLAFIMQAEVVVAADTTSILAEVVAVVVAVAEETVNHFQERGISATVPVDLEAVAAVLTVQARQ
jgi:hypothetical protein